MRRIFHLDSRSVPPQIAAWPIVLLLIALIVLLGAVLMFLEWLEAKGTLVSLIGAVLAAGFGISGLHLWARVKWKKLE